MVFGLFKKHCPICNMEVDKNGIARHGKYFCSEAHAKEYQEKMDKDEKGTKHNSSCCH